MKSTSEENKDFLGKLSTKRNDLKSIIPYSESSTEGNDKSNQGEKSIDFFYNENQNIDENTSPCEQYQVNIAYI